MEASMTFPAGLGKRAHQGDSKSQAAALRRVRPRRLDTSTTRVANGDKEKDPLTAPGLTTSDYKLLQFHRYDALKALTTSLAKAVMSDDTPDDDPEVMPSVIFRIDDSGASVNCLRRGAAVNFVQRALRAAMLDGTRFVAVFVNLHRADIQHVNMLVYDLLACTVHVFEPHGWNPLHEANKGLEFYKLYEVAAYERAVSSFVLATVEGMASGWSVFMPQQYEPEVFGQSVTRDSFCLLWCLWCFDTVATLSSSPCAFVALVTATPKATDLSSQLLALYTRVSAAF